MKRKSALIILLWASCIFLPTYSFAQKNEIKSKLKDYKINEDWLSTNLKEKDAIFYYKIKSVTGSNSGNITSVAEYDPRRKAGDRTHLLTVNGESPTKQEAKKFNKRFGKKGKNINGKIDPTSYKIIKDSEDFFVIGFRLIKENLPDRYQFLGDCDAVLHCRKDIMKASYAEFTNFQPTKVKMFNADKLQLEIYFTYDEESGAYVHEEARYYINAKLMGIPTEIEVLNYYSDYKIVK